MSADSELLIKIKTILETQGIDAAKAKITELTNAQSASTLSEAAANAARQKSETQAEKTARAILAMNNAMAGGMGPFRAAVSVANQLGGSFAMMAFKASAVGAAITLGWTIGTKLREWVTGAKDAETELEKLKKTSEELKDRVDKLATIRLANLKAEAAAIAEGFSTAVDKAERLKRLSDLREDAQLAVDLADVNLAFQKGEINQEERDRLEIKFQGESERRKLQSEEKSLKSQEEVVNATESQARGKYGELSRKAGMSQLDYEQAIKTLRDVGISNPEALIFGGKNSPEMKAEISRLNSVFEVKPTFNPVSGAVVPGIEKSSEKVLADRNAADVLSNLPDLKLIAEASKAEFETYKSGDVKGGNYNQIMAANEIKREELRAQGESLADRYKTHDLTYSAKDQAITNQIADEKRKQELDAEGKRIPEKASVARLAYGDLLGALRVGTDTLTDNTGRPVSQKTQSAYDQQRMDAARKAIRDAGVAAYNGGDQEQIMGELVQALKRLHVTFGGQIRNMEELRKVVDGLNGVVGDMKSQISVAKGLD